MVKLRWAAFLDWASAPASRRYLVGGLLCWNVLLHLFFGVVPYGAPMQARRDASGFSPHLAQRFHYFHYYTGHFPLATLKEDLVYTEEAARNEITEHGEHLIMEYRHWSRLGESARIFAYLPHAWVTGSARDPSIRLFNLLCFLAGSLVLYMGLARAGLQVLGTVLVLLVNLTPFFWYEVHSRENIFGLQASLLMFVIGLNARALVPVARPVAGSLVAAALSGAALAFCAEVRNETMVVLVSLLLLLVLAPATRWWHRLATLAVVLFTYHQGRSAIKAHFDQQWEATTALVAEHGGHVYNGARIPGHRLWHPLFCGLGDFGQDRGYAWDDRVAYAYAVPILNERYGMNIRYSGLYHTDDHYDAAGLYYVKFDEIEAYEDVMREKVHGDLLAHPWWYAGILVKRILRVLTVTLPVPLAGWLLFPTAWAAWRMRRWELVRLLFIALPLSATPLFIYSGDGATYVSFFPYVAIASLVLLYGARRFR